MNHQDDGSRAWRLLWLAALVGLLVTSGCGSNDGDGISSDGTTTSSSVTAAPRSSSTATTAPSTTETSPTTATTSGATTNDATSTTGAAATVADLEQALQTEIEARYPTGPGVVQCAASGQLTDWQSLSCTFQPDEPAEFGGIHVSILDGGRYAWDIGECCGAAPWPDDYPPGLFCRDLVEPPPGTSPDHYPPDTDHLTYGLVVFYWLTENRPDRMDEDLDGWPCETVYPASEVAAFWDSTRTL